MYIAPVMPAVQERDLSWQQAIAQAESEGESAYQAYLAACRAAADAYLPALAEADSAYEVAIEEAEAAYD